MHKSSVLIAITTDLPQCGFFTQRPHKICAKTARSFIKVIRLLVIAFDFLLRFKSLKKGSQSYLPPAILSFSRFYTTYELTKHLFCTDMQLQMTTKHLFYPCMTLQMITKHLFYPCMTLQIITKHLFCPHVTLQMTTKHLFCPCMTLQMTIKHLFCPRLILQMMMKQIFFG
jgi:hypothetical protein